MSSNVESQKQLLLQKTIGDEGPEITRKRMRDIDEILNFDSIYEAMIEMLSGLTSSTDFGVGLTDFDIFHVNFTFRLPTIDEILAGIYVVPIQVSLEVDFSFYVKFDLGQIYDPSKLLDYFQTLNWFFKDGLINTISWQYTYSKVALFDVTKYGEGIYWESDVVPVNPTLGQPIQLTPFQSNALMSLSHYASVKPWVVKQYTVMLGNEQLAKAYLMRKDFLEKTMKDAFFLGFSMLNYSPIRTKEIQNGVEGVTIHVTVDSRDIGIFVHTIDRICYGFILGVTPLGLGRFTPEEAYTTFRNTGPRYAFWRAMKQKQRFQSMATELLFTVPEQERLSIPRSPRVNVYGVHRHAQEQIRSLVTRVVPEAGPSELVKYYHATLEVIYKNRQSHHRIRNWKTQLSDDEFYQMWLEKWKTLGLNSSKLQQIYELVKTWEKPLLLEKVKKTQIIT
jgi:hypothetical protein